MDMGLAGKVAIVTGGSDGIGKGTAHALAREGAKVAICARRPDVLQAAADEIKAATGSDVLAVPTDVTNAVQVEAFVQQVIDTFGGVDILVNNAGASAAMPFESITDEGWMADIDLKLFSAIRMARLSIPSMRARGGGRIINITTVGGKAPGPNSMPSSVTRAAGLAMTKALSKEVAKDGINVNTVCIGVVRSGQIGRSAANRFPGMPLEDAFKEMGKGVPVGRIGTPEEAGDLITFLASGRGGFINGASINFDGGVAPVV